MKQKPKGKVLVYKNRVEVRLEAETVWLTQKDMASLFNTERSVITKHTGNIFKTKELEEKSNVQKMHIANSDKPVKFYNLDVIISVGYRVNSRRGTQFRIWATKILKQHLAEGYTINKRRLEKQEKKYLELKNVVNLIANVVQVEGLSEETKGIAQVISEYTHALDILDDFDHQKLRVPKGTKKAKYKITYQEARKIIDALRKKFKDSGLVGQEKDESFKSSLGAIYQTFNKKELYPTVEEKAAHLLYFVVKNHSFVDGNKRIAAVLFVCFLEKCGLLYKKDRRKIIDNNALVGLTLMIASSHPKEKEKIIRVVLNLLHNR